MRLRDGDLNKNVSSVSLNKIFPSNTHAYTHTHTHIETHTHTHIYTNIHIYIHTYINREKYC